MDGGIRRVEEMGKLFDMPKDTIYFDGAGRSPLLKEVGQVPKELDVIPQMSFGDITKLN